MFIVSSDPTFRTPLGVRCSLWAANFDFELRRLPFFEVYAWNIALLKECRFYRFGIL